MPIFNELQARILNAESTIDSVNQLLQSPDAHITAPETIEYAISTVEQLIPYEEQGALIYGKKPSECIKFLNRKLYEIQDPDHIFENLCYASSLSINQLDIEYECEDIIENCKSSNNIYDKLALAIAYSCLGSDYYNTSVSLFNEFLKTNPSNPCLTEIQILFRLADLHKREHKYFEALKVYSKLADICPDNPIVYEKTINTLIKISRKDLAEEALELAKNSSYYKSLSYFKKIIDDINL